jgi:undecaprenyl-diphosphatase
LTSPSPSPTPAPDDPVGERHVSSGHIFEEGPLPVPEAPVPPPWLREAVDELDRRADAALDRLRGNPVADRVMYAATEVGDFGLIWLLLGTAKGLRSDRDAADAVRIAAVLGVESVLVNGVIKSFFRRERPEWEQERSYKIRKPRSSSFPSGHASSAFTAAAMLSQSTPRLRPAWYAAAVVVATSRAHVRIHHASDVLGGVATGIVLGRIATRVWPAPVDGNPLSGRRARSRRKK